MRILAVFLGAVSCFAADFSASIRPQPLAFEVHGGVYVSHSAGYSLSVTAHEAVLGLGSQTVRMSMSGANRDVVLDALDRMPGKANYLLGANVRASYDLYGRVRWRGVYSGIDTVFRTNQECLEYDFEIGAGADPRTIRLAFAGIDGLTIDSNGDLVVRAGAMSIRQPKPIAYQTVSGQKKSIAVAYHIDPSGLVRFQIGAYDADRSLVIDPQIVFNKTIAGAAQFTGLARDTEGNLYVTGTIASANFIDVRNVNLQGGGGDAPRWNPPNGRHSQPVPKSRGRGAAYRHGECGQVLERAGAFRRVDGERDCERSVRAHHILRRDKRRCLQEFRWRNFVGSNSGNWPIRNPDCFNCGRKFIRDFIRSK